MGLLLFLRAAGEWVAGESTIKGKRSKEIHPPKLFSADLYRPLAAGC